jgi:hypothetical protein
MSRFPGNLMSRYEPFPDGKDGGMSVNNSNMLLIRTTSRAAASGVMPRPFFKIDD